MSGETRPPVPSIPQAHGSLESQRKPPSGFLSFLNCCGGSDGKSTADTDDPALPPKKAAKLQPPVRRTSRTGEKLTASETQQRRAEAEDEEDEKSASVAVDGRPSILSEKPPIPDSRPQLARSESPHDKVMPIQTVGQAASRPPQAPPTFDPPPVSIPMGQCRKPEIDETGDTNAANIPVNIAAPIPVKSEREPNEALQNEDMEMEDAHPEVPGEENEAPAEPAIPDTQVAKADLPPPPPLGKRDSQLATKETPPVPIAPADKQTWLLPPMQPYLKGRKCLVLDLDETLVHSSFKILNQADFTIPVEIEGQYHNVYVIKRPGVDAFMKRVGELYEVVVFTASVSKYGDPLLNQLDIHNVVHHRLFRESCYNHQGNYVKVR